MKKKHLLFLIVPLFIQCKIKQPNSFKMTSFEYIDGNANTYSITSSSIVYDPITAAESSTGTYSGGEPYSGKINKDQFIEILGIIKNCIDNKIGQTTQRNKGTGTLIIQPQNKTYIFEMNSAQKKEIEQALILLIPQ